MRVYKGLEGEGTLRLLEKHILSGGFAFSTFRSNNPDSLALKT
jgi:hypothetical protein